MQADQVTDQGVVQLLAKHTYDEVHEITGWSRGRIYQAACRLGGAQARGADWPAGARKGADAG